MRLYFIITLTIINLVSCKENSKVIPPGNGFIINVHIENVLNGRTAYLKTQNLSHTTTIDSTIINKGKFSFKGIINKPSVYGVFFDSIKGEIGLFMENDIITIEAYKDSLESSKIKGSKTHNEYLNFIKQTKRITSKINLLFPEFQKARAENNVKKLEEINIKMQAINTENTQFTLKYAKRYPDSYVSAFALYSTLRVPDIKKDTILKIYNNFSDYVKKGDYSIQILNYLDLNAHLPQTKK